MNTKFFFVALVVLPFLANAQAVPAINDFSSFDKEFGIAPKVEPTKNSPQSAENQSQNPTQALPVQPPLPVKPQPLPNVSQQNAPSPTPVNIIDNQPVSSEELESLSTIIKEDKKIFKPAVADKKKSSKTRKTYDYRIKPIPSILLQKSFSEQNNHIPVLANREDYTLLLYPAIQRGDLGAVRTLIERGGNINIQIEPDLLTPLSYAIIAEKNEIAKILVIRGADFNLSSVDGKTSAHFAAQKQNLSLLSFLCDYGADLYRKDNAGVTAIDLIAEDLRARFLIDRAKSKIELNNLLAYFVSSNDVTSAYVVLQKGADIEAKDSSGKTILLQAVQSSNYQMISMILANNPSLAVVSNSGENIVKLATQRNDPQVIALLESAVIRKELETGINLGLSFYEAPKPKANFPTAPVETKQLDTITEPEIMRNNEQNSEFKTLEDITENESLNDENEPKGSFFERLKNSLNFGSEETKNPSSMTDESSNLHEKVNEEPIPSLEGQEEFTNSIDQSRPKSIIPEALQ